MFSQLMGTVVSSQPMLQFSWHDAISDSRLFATAATTA
jgi:hypothetical protein